MFIPIHHLTMKLASTLAEASPGSDRTHHNLMKIIFKSGLPAERKSSPIDLSFVAILLNCSQKTCIRSYKNRNNFKSFGVNLPNYIALEENRALNNNNHVKACFSLFHNKPQCTKNCTFSNLQILMMSKFIFYSLFF